MRLMTLAGIPATNESDGIGSRTTAFAPTTHLSSMRRRPKTFAPGPTNTSSPSVGEPGGARAERNPLHDRAARAQDALGSDHDSVWMKQLQARTDRGSRGDVCAGYHQVHVLHDGRQWGEQPVKRLRQPKQDDRLEARGQQNLAQRGQSVRRTSTALVGVAARPDVCSQCP